MLYQSARTDRVDAAFFVDSDGVRDPGEGRETCLKLKNLSRLS
jgi:hypothetical protein